MKGPGFRYDLDIRRVWECPQCQKQVRYSGHITSRRCDCDEEGHWMKIVQERFRRTFPEREKIVIPEDEPEEAPAEETTGSDTPKQEESEAGTTAESAESPPQTDASLLTEDKPSQSGDVQQSPDSESESDEPRRKKRRKKRRRKKSREKNPDASGQQQSNSNKNSQSGSDGDDLGKNVS